MVAHNYRFVPAIRLAYDLIHSGKLGRIYHFRAVYLQEWIMPHYDTRQIWRLSKKVAGSGALGDLGSHIIDLGRFLCGEVKSLQAHDQDLHPDPPPARRHAAGRWTWTMRSSPRSSSRTAPSARWKRAASRPGDKNYNCWEINGEKGSIRFDLERMNELEVFWVGEEPKETQGWHKVLVTEGYHPLIANWWPHGHIIGWEHTFVHEINHLLDCIVNDKDVCALRRRRSRTATATRSSATRIVESASARRTVDLKY